MGASRFWLPITAIVTVRAQVSQLHGRVVAPWGRWVADVVALAVAAVAVLVEPVLLVGSCAVAGAIIVQHLLGRWPTERAVVLGLRQTALGISVVLVTALGVILG